MLYEIMFSPTGGTSKATRKFSAAWSCEKKTIDLFRRDYLKRLPELSPEDVCIISAPVFSGRIPSIAAERMALLKGNGARAVLLAAFGNRAVEDALVEMEDILRGCGFRIIAGVEAVTEHSVIRTIGAGRPDAADAACLLNFGRQVIDKLSSANTAEPTLPGNRPYRERGSGIIPEVTEGCINCAICARECPAGAISFGGSWVADPEKCISCLHCVRFCPKSYRTLDPQKVQEIHAKIGEQCETRKENKLYI